MVALVRNWRLSARKAPRALRSLRRDSLLRNSAYNMSATIVTALLGYVYWVMAETMAAPTNRAPWAPARPSFPP